MGPLEALAFFVCLSCLIVLIGAAMVLALLRRALVRPTSAADQGTFIDAEYTLAPSSEPSPSTPPTLPAPADSPSDSSE